MRDWPRIAKLQSDLLVHALASGQTRVASYMLTKCQSLTRFPWLGHTTIRHHDYTHTRSNSPEGQRIMRDICRWHVEEFAYLVGKLKSMPEGDGNMLDRTLLVYVHEHAEANSHKTSGMAAILAGHTGRLKTGMHSMMARTVGDLYLTLSEEVMQAPIGKFPSAQKKLSSRCSIRENMTVGPLEQRPIWITSWRRSRGIVRALVPPAAANQATAVVLQIRRAEVCRDRRCDPGQALRGDAKDGVDELALTDRIALSDPADLAFSDGMHRLVALDRSACPPLIGSRGSS